MERRFIKMEEFVGKINNVRHKTNGAVLVVFALIWALTMFILLFPLIGIVILFTVLLYILFFPFIKLEEYIKQRRQKDE